MSNSRLYCCVCVLLTLSTGTMTATVAWCEESPEPELELVGLQVNEIPAEATYPSPVVTPQRRRPGVSIGGRYGVIIGRGYGLRIGGPRGVQFGGGDGARFGGRNGVQFGGGEGVKIGPPPVGDERTEYPAAGQLDWSQLVTVHYPKTATHRLQFLVNGSNVVILPGETIQLGHQQPVVVRVPKRYARRGIRRSLEPGHYEFRPTSRGWRLFRVDERAVAGATVRGELPVVAEAPVVLAPIVSEPPAEEILPSQPSLQLAPPKVEIPRQEPTPEGEGRSVLKGSR